MKADEKIFLISKGRTVFIICISGERSHCKFSSDKAVNEGSIKKKSVDKL